MINVNEKTIIDEMDSLIQFYANPNVLEGIMCALNKSHVLEDQSKNYLMNKTKEKIELLRKIQTKVYLFESIKEKILRLLKGTQKKIEYGDGDYDFTYFDIELGMSEANGILKKYSPKA